MIGVVAEGIVFALVAMVSWGTADFLAKRVVEKMGSFSALMSNIVIGTIPLLIYSIFFVKLPTVTFNAILFSILSAFFGAFGYLMFYRAMERGKISIVSPISSSWSTVTFILALIFLSESLSILRVASALLVFAGIFLASIVWKEFLESAKRKTVSGAREAIFAMLGWGVAFLFVKFSVNGLGPVWAATIMRMFGILFLYLYSAKTKTKISFDKKLILFIVAIGLLDSTAFLTYNIGITTELVSVVSVITSSFPIVTLSLAYIFLKERLVVNQYLGILLIIAGVIGLAVF